MKLSERLSEYIGACFTGLWVESYEHEDALAEIAQMCRTEKWHLVTWDIDGGLQVPGQGSDQSPDAGGNDPLAAIRAINALASPNSSALLVLVNFHRFTPPHREDVRMAAEPAVYNGSMPFVCQPLDLRKVCARSAHLSLTTAVARAS